MYLISRTLQGLALSWMPRADGDFLIEPPQYAVLRGHVANVPIITGTPIPYVLHGVKRFTFLTGNCDDEGSLFSMASLNVTYDALLYIYHLLLTKATDGSDTKGVATYMKSFMMPAATDAQIDLLLQYYPDDYSAGCPFNTGHRNILSAPYLSPPTCLMF
jgi:acetylcholinesterase